MSLMERMAGLKQDTFGLDIGYESIKLIQLKKSGSAFKLIAGGVSPSIHEPFLKERIKDKKGLSTVIKKAISQHKITAKAVVSALPEIFVFTKIITMPKMSLQDLESAVPLDAASFIPFEPEQTSLDFSIVGEVKDKYEILIVAAPKTLVEDYVELIASSGLTLSLLETKPIANIRALIPQTKAETTLIVDFGTRTTSVTICKGQNIRMTATLSFGGQFFSKTVKTNDAVLANLAKSILENLKYYQGYREKNPITRILLSGGTALRPGLCNYIETKTSIRTEIGNPWQMVKNPPVKVSEPQYTTAIGLAMKEI